MDVDKYNKTMQKLEGEVTHTKRGKKEHNSTKPTKKAQSPQVVYKRYSQNEPTREGNQQKQQSQQSATKVRTKTELKQLDTSQTNHYASSHANSESNESFSSVDHRSFSDDEAPARYGISPKRAVSRPKSFVLCNRARIVEDEQEPTLGGETNGGGNKPGERRSPTEPKRRRYGKETDPPDQK
jgi:hypothetical protein